MPGTPPTTPNMAIPRYDDADLASFSAQLNAVSDRLDAIAARNDSPFLLKPADVIWSPVAIRQGCLLCNGQAVSRTTYAALYAALGGGASPWGQGDGATTFNVPDFRGSVPMGAGTRPGLTTRTVGQFVGEEKHVLSSGEMPSHSHAITDPGHAHGLTDPGHIHAITDPGHGHGGGTSSDSAIGLLANAACVAGTVSNAVAAVTGSVQNSPQAAGSWFGSGLNHSHTVLVSPNTTSISIVSHATGITVNGGATGITAQNTGGGTGHNVVQPSVVGNFWIKI